MLAELIERLEKAIGPDRELDGAIWLAYVDGALEKCWGVRGMKYAGHVHTKAEKASHIKRMSEYLAPHYTASIDAAVALAERVLPDVGWSVATNRIDRRRVARLWTGEIDDGKAHAGASPAIALCLAILNAIDNLAILRAKEDSA